MNIFSKLSNYRIVILGGHALGSHYVKTLLKAQKDHRLGFSELHVTDPNIDCILNQKASQDYYFHHESYEAFIAQLLIPLNEKESSKTLIIPDHTAPHVMLQLYLKLLQQEYPSFDITFAEDPLSWNTPFQRQLQTGITALSYATWACPADCDEPATCPATHQVRNWNLQDYVSSIYEKNLDIEASCLAIQFSCKQLVDGICSIDLQTIHDEWQRIKKLLHSRAHLKLFIATLSECHGIIGCLDLKNKNESNKRK